MKKHILALLCAAAATATTACIDFEHTSSMTSPTAVDSASALLGLWTSANVVPSPSSCTNFQWHATEQTSNSAKGSFSATCAGGLNVSGTAQGTLNGGTVSWSGSGTATAADLPSCPVSLSGTAELGADSIRIPYSGTTCLGPVSGVEILKKN
ncbi:MAG TPA: hypothetical protein VL484_08685 [Vicinamibacterales bacterium]|jgi:hypothetical protein|nr:hypothetical protein [Vicinamibacterales bacterium]